jgi:hypothetical protein
MNKNLNKISLSVVVAATIIGCGGSSSDTTSTTVSGQLVDNYVENVNYICQDGSSGLTDENGTFECNALPITFRVGGIKLGEISKIANDLQVFPQDLLNIDRNDTTNEDVVALAQLLQTLDSDDNPDNGITIDNELKAKLTRETVTEFSKDDLDEYSEDLNKTIKDEDEAREHLEDTINMIENIATVEVPEQVRDYIYSLKSTLDDNVTHALEYMGDEERLAYDIYNVLYNYYITEDFKQFKNILTKSEINHIAAVQAIVKKYDINSTELYDNNVSDLEVGVYKTEELQTLYTTLYNKGIISEQDAFEVGCMVEVTDVDDLDLYISQAEDINATDVVGVFEYLRNGSYNHYWGFDTGLKNMGVEDGCCALGEEWCKTEEEYPKQEHDDEGEEENSSMNSEDNNGSENGGYQYGKDDSNASTSEDHNGSQGANGNGQQKGKTN